MNIYFEGTCNNRQEFNLFNTKFFINGLLAKINIHVKTDTQRVNSNAFLKLTLSTQQSISPQAH